MRRVIILLIPIVLSVTCCKRQFINIGWYRLDKDQITKVPGLSWKLTQTREDLHLFFESGLTEIDREEIVDDFEDAYEEVLTLLYLDDYEHAINIFLLADDKSMHKISGSRDKMIVIPAEHLILMQLPVNNEKVFKKPLAQLIMQNIWGQTADWMLAGYSTYIAEYKEKDLIHAEAAHILTEHEVTLPSLILSYNKIDNSIRQILAGSFVLHLIEEHGHEVVKSIWLSNDLISKRKMDEMEKNWKAKLKKS